MRRLAKSLALKVGSDWALPGENINFSRPRISTAGDRCVTRGLPSMMMPYRYNGGFRIDQGPGLRRLQHRDDHEARMIPTDGRKPLDPNIKQYLGESTRPLGGDHARRRRRPTSAPTRPVNQPLINLAVVGSPAGNPFSD